MEIFNAAAGVDSQSISLIAFSVLLTFFLSALIVLTYEKVSQDVITPDHFLQSLMLMAIVTTTIMQSIGDSPARGFGIFGALAILRFRTQMISPRNISFIFAAMAVGIACGVYSFFTAIIGTIAFCAVAVFLRFTPFSRKNNLRGQLRLELPAEADARGLIEGLLRQHTRKFVLKRYRMISREGGNASIEYSYELQLNHNDHGLALLQHVQKISGVTNVRLGFDDTYINLYD